MPIQWFALIIPIVILLIAKFKFNYEITWLEFLLSSIVVIVFIILSTYAYTNYISDDEILRSGYVTGKQFIPAHSETRVGIRSNSEGDTQVYTYTVFIPNNWDAFAGLNFCSNITKERAAHNGELIGNHGEVTFHINEQQYKNTVINSTAVWLESFKNPLKRSKYSLYKDIKDKRYACLEMPVIYNDYCIDRIVLLDNISLEQKILYNKKLNEINSILNKFNINLGFVITKQAIEYVNYQENYWHGGNPNDFIIFIGVDNDKNIKYVKTICWENNYLKVKVRDDILNNVKKIDDFDTILSIVSADIEKYKFKVMDFNKFEYTQVELPLNINLLIYVGSIIISIIAIVITVNNENE